MRVHFAMRNAAGRSFFHRSGVGRVRHISLRVLWIQTKVKEGLLTVGKVTTKDNVSDLGTKRWSRDRMEYLMFLCKGYRMSEPNLIGTMKAGVKMLKKFGMNVSTSKGLMQILLLNALNLGVAMDSRANGSLSPGGMSGFYKLILAFLCALCMVVGFMWITAKFGAELQQRLQKMKVDCYLTKILQILRAASGSLHAAEHEGGESVVPTADPAVQSESDDESQERKKPLSTIAIQLGRNF